MELATSSLSLGETQGIASFLHLCWEINGIVVAVTARKELVLVGLRSSLWYLVQFVTGTNGVKRGQAPHPIDYMTLHMSGP